MKHGPSALSSCPSPHPGHLLLLFLPFPLASAPHLSTPRVHIIILQGADELQSGQRCPWAETSSRPLEVLTGLVPSPVLGTSGPGMGPMAQVKPSRRGTAHSKDSEGPVAHVVPMAGLHGRLKRPIIPKGFVGRYPKALGADVASAVGYPSSPLDLVLCHLQYRDPLLLGPLAAGWSHVTSSGQWAVNRRDTV